MKRKFRILAIMLFTAPFAWVLLAYPRGYFASKIAIIRSQPCYVLYGLPSEGVRMACEPLFHKYGIRLCFAGCEVLPWNCWYESGFNDYLFSWELKQFGKDVVAEEARLGKLEARKLRDLGKEQGVDIQYRYIPTEAP